MAYYGDVEPEPPKDVIVPVEENPLFTDEPAFIVDLLKRSWSLDAEDFPTITCVPEEYMTSARVGFIYVYHISRYNSVSSTNYSTIQRTSFIAIRLNTRFRHKLYAYMDEIYRIIYANRRVGQKKLNGYTFMEVINDRIQNDLSGWYSATMDVKLTSYNYPLRSHGFGQEMRSIAVDFKEDMVLHNNDEVFDGDEMLYYTRKEE